MKKLRIPISKAFTGMILADDVYNNSDRLVLPKGTELTEKIITRLKLESIVRITIDATEPDMKERVLKANQPIPTSKPIDIPSLEPTIQDQRSFSTKLKESKEYKLFSKKFDKTRSNVEELLTAITDTQTEIQTEHLFEGVDQIVNKLRNEFHVLDMVNNMKSYDDSTFTHSLNVALICNVFGRWLNMPDSEIQALTVAGMLHDIGKLKIPDSIIKKPERLTQVEFSIIKAHTMQGYNILNANDKIDVRIKNTALMHHEKFDGTGYPFNVKGDKIDQFARIISIVDVYEAMTSPREYREALCPFEAIRLFETEGLQKYDPKLIYVFMHEIIQTYMGNTVRLSNGIEGKIVYINSNWMSRPLIQVNGKNDEYIDLSNKKYNDLLIKAII